MLKSVKRITSYFNVEDETKGVFTILCHQLGMPLTSIVLRLYRIFTAGMPLLERNRCVSRKRIQLIHCDEMQKDACNCEILVEVNEVDMAWTMQTLSMIMGVAGSGRQAKPRDDRRINGR